MGIQGCPCAYLGMVAAGGTWRMVPAALTPHLPCLQAARALPPAGDPPAMAIVQTLPVPLEAAAEGAAQLRAAPGSPPAAMGSVSSLLPGRPRHDRPGQPCDGGLPTASFRKQEGLLRATPRDPLSPEEPHAAVPSVTHAYANGGFCGDWLDAPSPTSPCSDSDEPRDDRALSGHLRGPPPKLVPVSGKLEEVRGAGGSRVDGCWGLDFAPCATLGLSAWTCELGPHSRVFGVPRDVVVSIPLMPRPSCQGCIWEPTWAPHGGRMERAATIPCLLLDVKVSGLGAPPRHRPREPLGRSTGPAALPSLPFFPRQNMEKTLIRPMAFKPVVPKLRSAQAATRPGLSESQVSLTHLLGAEKPGSLSCRASTLSDSGRNSLSSLPTYSTGCSQHPEAGALPATPHGPPDPPGGCRPSNSDSGRSSSSKSTGSLSGRGRPSSESGSCGRSPLPGEEAMLVRELEDKLREREAELRLLRDSLDENEVAICQVRPWHPPVSLPGAPCVDVSPHCGAGTPFGDPHADLCMGILFSVGLGMGVFPTDGWSYMVPGGAFVIWGGQLYRLGCLILGCPFFRCAWGLWLLPADGGAGGAL